jgi:hydrogenase expression/formation protein HypC
MCLSLPCEVVSRGPTEFDYATVRVETLSREVSMLLCPQVKVGDWVLVQNGFITTVLDREQALASVEAFRELGAPLDPQ